MGFLASLAEPRTAVATRNAEFKILVKTIIVKG
jgi:hypothetical protein